MSEALAEIWNAEDKRHALDAVAAFKALYGSKFPKAAAKITDDVEELPAFYDYQFIEAAQDRWRTTRRTRTVHSRLKDLDPQVLTIAPGRSGRVLSATWAIAINLLAGPSGHMSVISPKPGFLGRRVTFA
jgi:hypothetical protein